MASDEDEDSDFIVLAEECVICTRFRSEWIECRNRGDRKKHRICLDCFDHLDPSKVVCPMCRSPYDEETKAQKEKRLVAMLQQPVVQLGEVKALFEELSEHLGSPDLWFEIRKQGSELYRWAVETEMKNLADGQQQWVVYRRVLDCSAHDIDWLLTTYGDVALLYCQVRVFCLIEAAILKCICYRADGPVVISAVCEWYKKHPMKPRFRADDYLEQTSLAIPFASFQQILDTLKLELTSATIDRADLSRVCHSPFLEDFLVNLARVDKEKTWRRIFHLVNLLSAQCVAQILPEREYYMVTLQKGNSLASTIRAAEFRALLPERLRTTVILLDENKYTHLPREYSLLDELKGKPLAPLPFRPNELEMVDLVFRYSMIDGEEDKKLVEPLLPGVSAVETFVAVYYVIFKEWRVYTSTKMRGNMPLDMYIRAHCSPIIVSERGPVSIPFHGLFLRNPLLFTTTRHVPINL